MIGHLYSEVSYPVISGPSDASGAVLGTRWCGEHVTSRVDLRVIWRVRKEAHYGADTLIFTPHLASRLWFILSAVFVSAVRSMRSIRVCSMLCSHLWSHWRILWFIWASRWGCSRIVSALTISLTRDADANRINKIGLTGYVGFAFVCVWISFCFRYMAAAETACGWNLENPLPFSVAAQLHRYYQALHWDGIVSDLVNLVRVLWRLSVSAEAMMDIID